MSDANEFFAEQDRRMSVPDEDVDEYIRTRLAASRKSRSADEHHISRNTSPSTRNSGSHAPQQPENTILHFPGDTCRAPDEGVSSRMASPVYPADDLRRHPQRSFGLKRTREEETVEMDDTPVPISLRSSSGPSPTLHASEHHAKRRRSRTESPTICSSHARTTVVPLPDPTDSRIVAGTGSAPFKGLLRHPPANPVGTRVSRRTLSRVQGQKGVFSSTDLAPAKERDPTSPAKTAQTIDLTASATEEDISSNSDAPPISTPDNLSAIESFSTNQQTSPSQSAVVGSTTSVGHKRHPRSPAGGIPKDTGVRVHPNNVAPSSSRLDGGSHEADNNGENPSPRTPAGFGAAAYIDCGNVTTLGDVPSARPTRRATNEAQPSSSKIPSPKKSKTTKAVGSDKNSRKASGHGIGNKKAKEKPKLTTPLEYAQKLQSNFDLRVIKPEDNFLKGKCIFYVGGDMMYASSSTRGRMDYIVKHGGTLVPKYDPVIVTHIVTEAGIRPTLKALSLKSLSDIPNHIPTVTWSWVISGHARAKRRKSRSHLDSNNGGDSEDEDDLLDYEFMHAAFHQRFDAGHKWKTSTHRAKQGPGVKTAHDRAPDDASIDHVAGDISHITTFSQANEPEASTGTEKRGTAFTVLPPAPLDFKEVVDVRKVTGHTPSEGERRPTGDDDPLSEYYAQARAEREARWNRDASDSDDGDDEDYHRGPVPRRGFACDIKGYKSSVCVNQHIVDKLEELRELHKAKSSEDDRWRAYSYGKCIPAIRNYPKPIRSFSEARSIRGVGEKTALKIMEIVNTGDLKRIKYENTEDVAATRVFQGIYGVGRSIAHTWFASGLRTLDDVRARKGGLTLTKAQEIGLEFYEDINSRMPREEAKRIFDMIKPIALDIDDKLFIGIMGSYRRGKADCGDIDVMITRPTTDGKTHQGVLRTLLDRLHTAGILTEDLALPDDFSDLELIYRGLCRLPEPGAKRRRIDFLCVPWANRGAALLYYTGDDIFNRAMRLKANRHGYSLNQRGLYADVLRDPHDRQKKVSAGHIVASETEEEIFKILGVPWQEPHERVRG